MMSAQLERAAQFEWQRTLPTLLNPAVRTSHHATAAEFLYVVATTGARFHILVLLPIEVVLLARLVAMLVLVGAGGAVCAKVAATCRALNAQITTDVFRFD